MWEAERNASGYYGKILPKLSLSKRARVYYFWILNVIFFNTPLEKHFKIAYEKVFLLDWMGWKPKKPERSEKQNDTE